MDRKEKKLVGVKEIAKRANVSPLLLLIEFFMIDPGY